MKQRILGAGLSLSLALGVAMSAASDVQAAPAMLPAHEVVTIIRSAGFVPISPAMRRGETYVLRATAPDGQEVRVIVDARRGEVLSARPVTPAMGERLGAYERMGPYERMGGYDADAPERYIPPPGVYEAAPPPVVYEGGRPLVRRPAEGVPVAPPRSARSAVPEAQDDPPISAQPPIMREERGEHGLLPPPPERFPQRATPAAPKPETKPAPKPAAVPVKRAAAAPQATPLPKPRPDAQPAPAAPAAAAPAAAPPAASAPVQAAPEPKVDPRSLPH